MVRCILQRQNSPGDVIERLYKIEIYRCTWQRNKHQIFDLKLLYRGCVKIRHIDMRNRCKKISHFRPTYTSNSFIKHWTRKNWHLNIGEVSLVGNRKSTVNHTTFSFFFFFSPPTIAFDFQRPPKRRYHITVPQFFLSFCLLFLPFSHQFYLRFALYFYSFSFNSPAREIFRPDVLVHFFLRYELRIMLLEIWNAATFSSMEDTRIKFQIPAFNKLHAPS